MRQKAAMSLMRFRPRRNHTAAASSPAGTVNHKAVGNQVAVASGEASSGCELAD